MVSKKDMKAVELAAENLVEEIYALGVATRGETSASSAMGINEFILVTAQLYRSDAVTLRALGQVIHEKAVRVRMGRAVVETGKGFAAKVNSED